MHALAAALTMVVIAASDEPWRDAERADTRAVERALRSAETTWQFLVAPDSPYAERLSVARASGRVLDASYLRRIYDARDDLQRSYAAYAPEMPKESAGGSLGVPATPGKSVRLLGHEWIIPPTRPAYPMTFEQRSQAPWPWQAANALDDAWRSILERVDFSSFMAYVRTLPCKRERDAKFVRELTTAMGSTRRQLMPTELVGIWRNLLLRTNDPSGNALSKYLNTWTLRFDDDNAWRYAHVFLIDRIDRGDVYGASFHLHDLTERINAEPGRELKGRFPHTAALRITPDRKELQAGANQETAGLERARAELMTVKQCRTGDALH